MDLDPPSLLYTSSTLFYDYIGLIILVILLSLIVVFTYAEKIFFSINVKDLIESESQQQYKIKTISKLLEKPKKLLITFHLCNYTLKIVVIWIVFRLGYYWFSKILLPEVITILTIFIATLLLLFFGEIIPRIYLGKDKISIAKRLIFPVLFLEKILSPISLPIRSVIIYLQDNQNKKAAQFAVEKQDNNNIGQDGTENYHIDEQKILNGIISFGNTEASQVMTPRIDIFAVEKSEPFNNILPKIIEKGFSRIPVYNENIDEITGVLFVKDIIAEFSNKNFDWNTVIRKPFFVPENKKLDSLLKDFQSLKNHLAIVVDEYGGTSGLLTLEDVIEEIVGDISDEFDEDEFNFIKLDDKNYIFEGKINLIDFYKIIEVDETLFEHKSREAETLAGLILEILENFPVKGQKVQFENCLFTIEAVDKKRIKQIKVTLE